MPGGELVTATPSAGTPSAKAAGNLKAATHAVVSVGSGAPALSMRVVHAEGAQLDAASVVVMDLQGHELASARLVDSKTVPKQAPWSGANGACELRSFVEPVADLVGQGHRKSFGRTGEVGVLVTAGGADHAIGFGAWGGFHHGAKGIPGVPGDKATQTRGVKGVKGFPGKRGGFEMRLRSLRADTSAPPAGGLRVTHAGDMLRVRQPGVRDLTANLRTGRITLRDYSAGGGEALEPSGADDAAAAATAQRLLVENAAALALVVGSCIAMQIGQAAAGAMMAKAAGTSTAGVKKNGGAGAGTMVLMLAAGAPTLSVGFWGS